MGRNGWVVHVRIGGHCANADRGSVAREERSSVVVVPQQTTFCFAIGAGKIFPRRRRISTGSKSLFLPTW